MNVTTVAFTKNGAIIEEKIIQVLEALEHKVYRRNKDVPLKAWCKGAFESMDAIIFVSATGIAVRTVAPFLISKESDPAVLVVDDRGKNVISLLSGHIGGANTLTLDIAAGIGSHPVVTTATDVNGKIAIDQWAAENNMVIHNIKVAKDIAMELLEDKSIFLQSSLPVNKLDKQFKIKSFFENEIMADINENISTFSINIGWSKPEGSLEEVLWLIPKRLALGIGCRRGKSYEEIKVFLHKVLAEYNIDERAISGIYTIDLKADEVGVLELAKKMNVPLTVYTAEELNNAIGHFPASEFVRRTTGTDNVCQRAVSLATSGGKVIVEKQAENGITIAIGYKEEIIDVI